MPVRILHFIGQLGVGGCEMQLLGLCRRLDRSRFEFAVCSYASRRDSLAGEFEKAGAKVFFVDKFGGISKIAFLRTLRRFIAEFRPDIIHTWQYSANVWGRLAGLTSGYRRFISSERSARAYGVHMWLLERMLGRQTVWTGNTSAVADTISEYLGVPRAPIRIIHNAVEMPQLDRGACRDEVRRELGLAPDARIVLTVGRQTPAKNYPMFFRTAERVVKQFPDVVFVAAGHGEQEAELREILARMQLGNTVRMLGVRHDVPRLLGAADLFCFCSDWEGFPNALVEALAAGLPAVATSFAGVREIVEAEAGLLCRLVDCGRDDQMAEQLCQLLEDPQCGRALGDAARRSVAERFSWNRLVDTMSDLYTQFLTGSHSSCRCSGQRAGRGGYQCDG